MAYTVTYQDETGYSWTSTFASEGEAMAQAVEETILYGGTLPQQIEDSRGVVVVDQAAIEAAAAETT